MSRVDSLALGILQELYNEFVNQKRHMDELNEEYVGVPMAALKEKLCGDSTAHDVNFDLALKGLVEKQLVGTGPTVMVEFPQSPGILVMPMFASKNEFAYLKEKGYKEAQKAPREQRSSRNNNQVHISGGTFYHSPFGVGEHITQSVVGTVNSAPVFTNLRNAVLDSEIELRAREDLLVRIEAMEKAQRSGGFIERYQDFIECAANHMTLIAPFVPALSALLK